jgi:hypothetical protein
MRRPRHPALDVRIVRAAASSYVTEAKNVLIFGPPGVSNGRLDCTQVPQFTDPGQSR